jgi:excisionase family DNA binding protein
MGEDSELPNAPGYMTVREVADELDISERMVHTYIQDGRLPGYKMGRMTIVKEEDFRLFQRSKKGRPRTRLPIWRKSVGDNFQYLTLMTVHIRPGQGEILDQKLEEMRVDERHLLPGTVARYIARNEEKPDEVQIVLIWRSTVMPPKAEREAALAALRAELAEILDWGTAWSESGRVLMHT